LISHLVCALSLVVFYILQSTVFSRITLIAGAADLILLFLIAWSLQEEVKNTWLWTAVAGVLVSLISAMPYFAPLIVYLGVVGVSNLLQKRVWRIPILAMFLVTILGTIIQHVVYIIVLQVQGAPISWEEGFDAVLLPSVLLNLIFALPVYAIANELVGRIYPLEVET
jgi:rod shape-determining protein MreD